MKISPNIYHLLLAAFCFLPSVIFAQSAEALPQGLWTVVRITMEESSGGKTQTTSYNTTDEVKDLIRFPQAIQLINAEEMVLSYSDREENFPATYTLENDKIQIVEGVLGYNYQYKINDGELILSTSEFYYVKNLQDGAREEFTGRWRFYLKKST